MKKLLLFLLLLSTFSITAQDFTIENFDINLTVNSDGSFDIIENIEVNFEKKKRGIYRNIPTRYKKNGKSFKLGIKNVKVREHKSNSRWKNGHLEIKIGDKNVFLKGKQNYQISYTIQNGILDFENHQELYYDLTGNDWEAEIKKVTFVINLPKSITLSSTDLIAATGYSNQVNDGIKVEQSNSRTIRGYTERTLKKKEGATIALKLPKTYLSVSELASNTYRQQLIQEEKDKVPQNPWYMALPIALLGIFMRLWNKIKGKENNPKAQESYAYPPEGLTSAHVGAYIDQTANTRDIVSLIPYWASEGFLEMKSESDETILIKKEELPQSYPNYEHTIFKELFKNSNVKSMEDLKEKFYTTLSKAKSELTKEVHSQGYYKEDFIQWFRTWRIIIFPVCMFIIAAFSFAALKQAPLGIASIVIGVIGLFFGFGKLPLSPYGKDIKYKLDGLKKFLQEMPESDVESILSSDPKYFDKMLPFAVAFGIEKTFIPKFERSMESMPHWYHTTNNNGSSFASFQSGFKTENISSAFSSAPATSSSGSSGGGFSSGGGIGGGGGGSW